MPLFSDHPNRQNDIRACQPTPTFNLGHHFLPLQFVLRKRHLKPWFAKLPIRWAGLYSKTSQPDNVVYQPSAPFLSTFELGRHRVGNPSLNHSLPYPNLGIALHQLSILKEQTLVRHRIRMSTKLNPHLQQAARPIPDAFSVRVSGPCRKYVRRPEPRPPLAAPLLVLRPQGQERTGG